MFSLNFFKIVYIFFDFDNMDKIEELIVDYNIFWKNKRVLIDKIYRLGIFRNYYYFYVICLYFIIF